MRDLLAWADVLVHPSLTEAFGVAVAEAQAMGLPVVCSDAGGLPENVDHGVTGFVVPRRDAAALASGSAAARRRSRAAPADGRGGPPPGRDRSSTTASSSTASRPSTTQLLAAAADPAAGLPLREARARRRRAAAARELRERLAAGGDQPGLSEHVWRREVVELVHDVRRVASCRPARACSWSAAATRTSSTSPATAASTSRRPPDGRYAGHHPADSDEAIAHLTALREAGADFLVIPGTVGLVARPLRRVRAPPRPALPADGA